MNIEADSTVTHSSLGLEIRFSTLVILQLIADRSNEYPKLSIVSLFVHYCWLIGVINYAILKWESLNVLRVTYKTAVYCSVNCIGSMSFLVDLCHFHSCILADGKVSMLYVFLFLASSGQAGESLKPKCLQCNRS